MARVQTCFEGGCPPPKFLAVIAQLGSALRENQSEVQRLMDAALRRSERNMSKVEGAIQRVGNVSANAVLSGFFGASTFLANCT